MKMKSIVKWLVKKFVTNEKIKAAIRRANSSLAKLEANERTQKITGYCADATKTVAAYTTAFSNDGKMDEGELFLVDTQCDKMVDKYLSDAAIDAAVEAIFV